MDGVRVKKISNLGLLLAIALILGYVETLVPIPFYVPGMKLGLSNLAVMFALYTYGHREAFVILIMKVLLTGFMFGNLVSIGYSLGGGTLALIFMVLCKFLSIFSKIGVSMSGGVAHNLGQLAVAAVLLETKSLIFYLPILMLSGLITGFFLGIICHMVLERLKGRAL